MSKKSIETKVGPSSDALSLFCIDNAENIVGCGWYDTKYCQKTCKFYKQKQGEEEQALKQAKYWNH